MIQPGIELPAVQAIGRGVSTAAAPIGGVQFGVNVSVDMAEMAGWEPARIAAFFSGIAEVLSAKKGVEPEE
jgi:hypothetical protein